jgi:hypothetical protein
MGKILKVFYIIFLYQQKQLAQIAMDAQIIENARSIINSLIFRMNARDVKCVNGYLDRQMEMYRVHTADSLQVFLNLRDKLPQFMDDSMDDVYSPHWKRIHRVIYIADYLQLYDYINSQPQQRDI